MIPVTPSGLRRAVDTAVLLPGIGSDEVFVASVFAGPLAAFGLALRAPRPAAGGALADVAGDSVPYLILAGICLATYFATRVRYAEPLGDLP